MIHLENIDRYLLDRRFQSYIFKNSILILEAANKSEIDYGNQKDLDWMIKNISKAIENRYHIGFYYEESESSGVKSGFRLVEPHLLGQGYKNGNKISHPDDYYLRGYLVKDSQKSDNANLKIKRKSVSLSDKEIGWRLFKLNRIKSLQVIETKFKNTREGYNPHDTQVANILSAAEVK